MRNKYKHTFDTLLIPNRWKQKKYMRSGSWVIIGFSKDFFSSNEYEYRVHLFGIDFGFWMKRELLKQKNHL